MTLIQNNQRWIRERRGGRKGGTMKGGQGRGEVGEEEEE
jgi:hypothetical protein